MILMEGVDTTFQTRMEKPFPLLSWSLSTSSVGIKFTSLIKTALSLRTFLLTSLSASIFSPVLSRFFLLPFQLLIAGARSHDVKFPST